MRAVAAVMIGVILADECGVALAERAAIRIDIEFEQVKRLAVFVGEACPVCALFGHSGILARAKPGRDGIKRIVKIAPFGRTVNAAAREGAGFGGPSSKRRLRVFNLFSAHAVEEIIRGIEFADMIKTQPAITARPVKA